MKIKAIAVFYTILVLGFGLFFWNRIQNRTAFELDMLDLNTKAEAVTSGLKEGSDRDALESEYNCEIILVSDSDYESYNNIFIKEGYSVFDYRVNDAIEGKIAFNARAEEYAATTREQKTVFFITVGGAYLLGLILLFIIWYLYVRPFNKLKFFAANVSKGNFDIPLNMTKHNYFGAFTESFDRMREELKLSNEREAAANRSKQELVAELSHDIKTPVATIKATCEVMELKYKDGDIKDKVDVIKSKADSVEHLVDNLLRASLEEIDELKVNAREESSLIIDEMISDLRFYGTIKQNGSVPECLILADRLRLEQVIDNIAGNSFKYAGTELEIEYKADGQNVHVIFSDRGPGVPEEELMMLTSKFYRGSAASESGKDGSGLGLYLASRFMEKMGGGLEILNREGGGLTVEIVIRKV